MELLYKKKHRGIEHENTKGKNINLNLLLYQIVRMT
jgi:hypothetical protein